MMTNDRRTAGNITLPDPRKGTLRQQTVRLCRQACVFIAVANEEGDQSIGTAFHIGDGIFLTARHVLDGNTIVEINRNDEDYLGEEELNFNGPYYHENPNVDVAAFKLVGFDQNTPHLLIGGHYDDWINDNDWVLSTGVAFGYPPVPFTKKPVIVGATVEINAIVDTTLDRYVRFVVSEPPRGGFSGGPVWHEWGFLLGMITHSLETMTANNESGFFTVLGIEAIRECLEYHDLLPEYQRIEV